MLDVLFDKGPVAGFRERVAELPGGSETARAARNPGMAFFTQDACSTEDVPNVLGRQSNHDQSPEVRYQSQAAKSKKAVSATARPQAPGAKLRNIPSDGHV